MVFCSNHRYSNKNLKPNMTKYEVSLCACKMIVELKFIFKDKNKFQIEKLEYSTNIFFSHRFTVSHIFIIRQIKRGVQM